NASDAMDLMQEVFLGVYRNLHRFRGDAKFSSWLYRIAHNKAVDMNRRKKLFVSPSRHGEDGDDPVMSIPSDDDVEPDYRMGQLELNIQIQQMLAQLPHEQKLVVELKVFQSLTFEEIADMQDISVNTAKTRFYTALKKLKVVSEEQHVLS
ncbi:MAG: RNA polymerase sigma factor, partial [Gammaproteobacteria bacterium]